MTSTAATTGTTTHKTLKGFTNDERVAMKERARELKAEARGAAARAEAVGARSASRP